MPCECIDQRKHSGTFNGQPRNDCLACGRPVEDQPWRLTPSRMRAMFEQAAGGAPDLHSDEVSVFASNAISRAFGLGVEGYNLHGFLKPDRQLRGEAEDELLDAANYAVFVHLRDVFEGVDVEKRQEDYMSLCALIAETIRLHKAWRQFWGERS